MAPLPSPAAPDALVVMVKSPRPGTVKTRLCPPLTPVESASLYGCFLDDIARELTDWGSPCDCWIAWADDEAEMPADLAGRFAGFRQVRQQGDGLAARMDNVFDRLFRLGYQRVVMRNSDSPHLPLEHIDAALAALRGTPGCVALGPDLDGGFYLVGLDAPPGDLFPRTLSTDSVCAETQQRARAAGRPVTLLPTFLDVDTPDDLLTFWIEFGSRADVRHWATWNALADGALIARIQESE